MPKQDAKAEQAMEVWRPTEAQRAAVFHLRDYWGLTLLTAIVIYLRYGLRRSWHDITEYTGLARRTLDRMNKRALRHLNTKGFDCTAFERQPRPRIISWPNSRLDRLAGKP